MDLSKANAPKVMKGNSISKMQINETSTYRVTPFRVRLNNKNIKKQWGTKEISDASREIKVTGIMIDTKDPNSNSDRIKRMVNRIDPNSTVNSHISMAGRKKLSVFENIAQLLKQNNQTDNSIFLILFSFGIYHYWITLG